MVDSCFIESLFKKNEIFSKEDKEKVLGILEEVNQQQDVEKVITSFADKIDLAKKMIVGGEDTSLPIMPLYYDKSGIWWRWLESFKRWEIIDEIDLMNHVTWSSPANTINSRERGEILQALKQVARANPPIIPDRNVLQFGDEMINLETGERGKASSKYFLTNPIPYNIGRSEETPNIDRIFKEWVGEENVLLLKEILAYCMLRDYPIHRIFCFIGSGMNGKSCFLNLLRKFIGYNNCCSTELDTLLNSRFEVTRLHKKLVCQMGETNFNEMNKTSILKKLSGGDLIGFEYKNKTPFEDTNYAKIIIATNNLPTTTDKTIGFYRRWIIIDFPNQFSEKKDILSEIPEEEYPNLANQLVKILMDLLKKREFHNEGSIEERIEKYESKSNPLERFMKEFVSEDCEGSIWKWEFNEKLKQWCKENRFREISDVAIGRKMKELGINQKLMSAGIFGQGKQWRAWLGIKWKDGGNQDNQDNQVSSTCSLIGELSGVHL